MRLLLDTHVWLWSLLDHRKLGARVTRELRDPESELWLSPISTWELLVLVEKGRVILDSDPLDWVRSALESTPLKEAPLTHEVALESRRIRLPHRDPADLFLASTARVYGLTLATSDERLLKCRDFKTLANH